MHVGALARSVLLLRFVHRSAAFAVIAAAIVAFVPGVAGAQGEDEAAPSTTRVEWNDAWPKFRWWEYGITAASWGATITSGYVLPDTPFGWRGQNGFDEGIRDGLRWGSRGARLQAATVSDAIFYGLAAYPIIVDGLIVTLGVHRKPEVAYQMIMTDIEALGVAGLLSTVTERTGRERPYVRTCPLPPSDRSTGEPAGAFSVEAPCEETGRNQSFVSGHAAAAFAGAGLICVNHDVFRLYGARAADISVCAVGMGAASVAAYLRVASDVHYATDVLGATVVGLGSGLVLPYLLRYGSTTTTPGLQRVAVTPLGGRDTVGLSITARLP
jgi:membrane-associated phospholipid phosphatase